MKKVIIPDLLLPIMMAASLISSCYTPDKSGREKVYLPAARGADGVILVVMDSALWADSLGRELKKTFSNVIMGLPQDEPYFTIRQINPLRLNSILKAAKNMLFVTTLDTQTKQSRAMRNFMTEESLKKINSSDKLFKFSNRNVYANGQEILHLFGRTQNQLIANIIKNRSALRNYFLNIEKNRIVKTMLSKQEDGKKKMLKKKHGFTVDIPYGWDLAKNEDNFVWLRSLDPEFEKNVFVHHEPFSSHEPFNDPVAYREQISSKFIRDAEKPDVYMTLQKVNHLVSELNFKGKYAKEVRGLWKLSDTSGGGPFVSYTFVDESRGRMYYIEGYVYNPGDDKRQFMREMEVILATFKSGDELKE